jgi:hypothetical protein
MSEYYEGTSERETEGGEDINLLEEALDRAAGKYFDRYPKMKGEIVKFHVVEMDVFASHNPIHGYRVVLRPESP